MNLYKLVQLMKSGKEPANISQEFCAVGHSDLQPGNLLDELGEKRNKEGKGYISEGVFDRPNVNHLFSTRKSDLLGSSTSPLRLTPPERQNEIPALQPGVGTVKAKPAPVFACTGSMPLRLKISAPASVCREAL